jgi:cell pole-organizing protein PopZ
MKLPGDKAMRQAGEPTVEEILESIKKVIARDNRTGAAEERRARETAGMADPGPVRDDAADEEDEDILDLAESAELADRPSEGDGPLVTADVQASMRDSLAALAMLSEPGAPPQIVRSGETSLEGLVRDLLRPALAQWLDKNLPPLVERMVAAEIARIVAKRG